MRPFLALLALSLACAAGAQAHGGGAHAGFVSTVSGIEPPQLGLLVEVLGGHERLSVRNLTQTTIRFEERGVVLEPGEAAAGGALVVAAALALPLRRREGES